MIGQWVGGRDEQKRVSRWSTMNVFPPVKHLVFMWKFLSKLHLTLSWESLPQLLLCSVWQWILLRCQLPPVSACNTYVLLLNKWAVGFTHCLRRCVADGGINSAGFADTQVFSWTPNRLHVQVKSDIYFWPATLFIHLGGWKVVLSDPLAPPYSQQLVVVKTSQPGDIRLCDWLQFVQVQAVK